VFYTESVGAIQSDLLFHPTVANLGGFPVAQEVWHHPLGLLARAPRTAVLPPSGRSLIVGMLLAFGLEPRADAVAKIAFVVFFVATFLFGG
jgi:hypothetical protein